MTRNTALVHSPSSTTSNNFRLQLPHLCDPPGPANPSKQRVWVIFGGSGHIGRSVLKSALAHGDLVTAVGKLHEDNIQAMASLVAQPPTTPNSSQSPPAPPPASSPKYHHPHPRYLPLVCDVRIPASVSTAISASIERWGRIDIIANCSGYGVIGSCEDQDDSDIRGQLETNFFGTLNIIQASLPYFRARGMRTDSDSGSEDNSADSDDDESNDDDETEVSEENPRLERRPRRRHTPKHRGGRYLIFSSTSGALGVPGLGPYCATKYAVEGLVESLLYEIDTFGIRATLVEPGHVRRDDSMDEAGKDYGAGAHHDGAGSLAAADRSSSAGQSLARLPTYGHFLVKPPSKPYAGINAPAAHARRMVQWLHDKQPTSAVKAAELVWQLGHCRYPPLRLLLGTYAVESVRDRLRTIMEEIEDWKFLNFGGQPPSTGQDARAGGSEQKSGAEGGTAGGKAAEGELDENGDLQDDEGEGDYDDDDDGADGEEEAELSADEDMQDADVDHADADEMED